jgi:acetyl esterase/lipase
MLCPRASANGARALVAALIATSPVACSRGTPAPATLAEARRALQPHLARTPDARPPAPAPPPGILEKVTFTGPLGPYEAYASPVGAQRRPAIVWIAGGFEWGLDASAWRTPDRDNDQSARAFREAGMVLMLPALRGNNGSPGDREYFVGEVDDVLAAVAYVRARPDVDPARVYLGGHSTGGTLALLAAASGLDVRAVVAFGPVDDVRGYGKSVPFELDEAQARARSPVFWMHLIRSPTWVIEGARGGNADVFPVLRRASASAPVSFYTITEGDHFDVLAPLTEHLARKMMTDAGPPSALGLSEGELEQAFVRGQVSTSTDAN